MATGGLVEGIDYYIENGRWVFTAEYLRERGHCCQSGCRHCPFRIVARSVSEEERSAGGDQPPR